jgi:hypothetical protein
MGCQEEEVCQGFGHWSRQQKVDYDRIWKQDFSVIQIWAVLGLATQDKDEFAQDWRDGVAIIQGGFGGETIQTYETG